MNVNRPRTRRHYPKSKAGKRSFGADSLPLVTLVEKPPASALQVVSTCLAQEYDLHRLAENCTAHGCYCRFADDEKTTCLYIPVTSRMFAGAVSDVGGYSSESDSGVGPSTPLLGRPTHAKSLDHSMSLRSFGGAVSRGERILLPTFVFNCGVVVTWGLTLGSKRSVEWATHERLLDYLRPYSNHLHRLEWQKETRHFYLPEAAGSDWQMPGLIHIKTDSVEEKVALSLALCQSVVLDTFEASLDSSVEKIVEISAWEASGSQAGPEIVKQTAWLYVKSIDVNVFKGVVDIPELFWEAPEYQSLWMKLHSSLLVDDRLRILNQRTLILQEALGSWNDRRKDMQEIRLTKMIIWLLVILIVLRIAREAIEACRP